MAEPIKTRAIFPGIVTVLGGTFTWGQGEAPSTCLLKVAPQPKPPALIGTLLITYGNSKLEFKDCRAVEASYRRDGAGNIVSLVIEDWRWRWRFGFISGRYNRRDSNHKIISRTEQTPQQLATLCFQAMGQEKFNVSALPNDARPAINWDVENPAQALSALCELLGCRISPDYGNEARIVKLGDGDKLPQGPSSDAVEFNESLDPPEVADSIELHGGPAEFQYDFEVEPVALEKTGEYVPLDDVSYKPTEGWTFDATDEFHGIKDLKQRALAKASVYRAWRFKMPKKGLVLPGFTDLYKENVLRLDQFAILDRQCVQVVELGKKVFRPAWLYGAFVGSFTYGDNAYDNTIDEPQPIISPDTELAYKCIYRGGYSIDHERNIIITSDPLVEIIDKDGADKGKLKPAVLRFRTAVSVYRDKEDSLVRAVREHKLTSKPTTKPMILQREEIILRCVPEYEGKTFKVKKIEYNEKELNKEFDYYIDLEVKSWKNLEPAQATYAGIKRIRLDGAIQHIVWRFGESQAAITQVSRNNEMRQYITPYKERRLNAKIENTNKEKGGEGTEAGKNSVKPATTPSKAGR